MRILKRHSSYQLRCFVMMNGGDAKGAKNENEGIQELAKKIRQT